MRLIGLPYAGFLQWDQSHDPSEAGQDELFVRLPK